MWTRLFCLVAAVNLIAADAPFSVKTIQKTLMAQPWAIGDREEKVVQREARAELMARALWDAVEELQPVAKKTTVAAAITIWREESRFSLEVHQGLPSRWGSDDGKAKCFGQIHQRAVGIRLQPGEKLAEFRDRQRQVWESLAGTDYESTKQCALATMRTLLSYLKRCGAWNEAFAAYGTGGNCEITASSDKRAKLLPRIVRQL